MQTIFVLTLLLVVAAALAVPMIRKRNVLGEVDRFQHARSLTTSWSDDPPAQRPAPEE
ncbi:MAG: hypothetical protein Q8R60_17160 [Mycobacteriales bacterium]|nr:hypothetical protein [Mycobacteriales bacterium]